MNVFKCCCQVVEQVSYLVVHVLCRVVSKLAGVTVHELLCFYAAV